MRSERWWKNSLVALLVFVVVFALFRTGLPVSERVEEYIAFVLVTDFPHEALARQTEVFGEWSSAFEWWEGLRSAWERLKGLFSLEG